MTNCNFTISRVYLREEDEACGRYLRVYNAYMEEILQFLRREKYVALHAQPRWLRVVKYPVFLGITVLIVYWKGWVAATYWGIILFTVGLSGHFFLRWMTHGWRKSWGPYKKLKKLKD